MVKGLGSVLESIAGTEMIESGLIAAPRYRWSARRGFTLNLDIDVSINSGRGARETRFDRATR